MGYSLVNILGGLLIVTSTMVVVSKTIPSAIKWYAIQSVVLVGVLLTLGLTTGATELLMWAASAFVTKVILVPFILNRAYKKMGSPADSTLTSSIKPAWTIILTGLEVAICFAVVTRLSLPTAEVATPALAISFAHFFVGLTCIISQRNILKQIFGYCLMENGSHVTLAPRRRPTASLRGSTPSPSRRPSSFRSSPREPCSRAGRISTLWACGSISIRSRRSSSFW